MGVEFGFRDMSVCGRAEFGTFQRWSNVCICSLCGPSQAAALRHALTKADLAQTGLENGARILCGVVSSDIPDGAEA